MGVPRPFARREQYFDLFAYEFTCAVAEQVCGRCRRQYDRAIVVHDEYAVWTGSQNRSEKLCRFISGNAELP
jgi:hypothetical protein